MWDFSGLAVGFGELLDLPPVALELLGNRLRIHAVVDNSSTYLCIGNLVNITLTWLIVGTIATTRFWRRLQSIPLDTLTGQPEVSRHISSGGRDESSVSQYIHGLTTRVVIAWQHTIS